MSLSTEFRSQMILADDKYREQQIHSDRQEQLGARRNLANNLIRIVTSNRIATDNRAAQEQSDRRRAREAEAAARGQDYRERRTAISGYDMQSGVEGLDGLSL